MNNCEFIDICLTKKGAYVDFPFGEDVCVVKVKNKIFAQSFFLKGIATITLNCTLEGGFFYRNCYEGIVTRGYHCPPNQQPYFNSMPIEKLPDEVIIEMIEHSYSKVVSKLPKYVQAELSAI